MAEESAGSDSGVAQEPEQAKQQEEDEEGDGDGDEKGSPPWKRRKAEGSTSNEGSSATQHGGFEKSTFNPKVKGVTPLQQLMNALKEQGERKNKAEKGENVVFWMRMHDLRSEWLRFGSWTVVGSVSASDLGCAPFAPPSVN